MTELYVVLLMKYVNTMRLFGRRKRKDFDPYTDYMKENVNLFWSDVVLVIVIACILAVVAIVAVNTVGDYYHV